MAEEEVAQFLTNCASDLSVAPSTQNQALSALLFLYKEVPKYVKCEDQTPFLQTPFLSPGRVGFIDWLGLSSGHAYRS
jgi:integrase-like protein